MSTLITIIGMIGAVVLLCGYMMVSARKLSGDGLPYQLLNFGGGIALMINSAYHSAWPSAILNMVWSGVGVITIGRVMAGRAARRPGL
ncbi:CBU_0592 family membrane protein [Sphaerimonospora mesophila]|uniref:CBU_0592 family membrane protein n=1 Tax=Sphaerimonospora mesophila TaxID=37483 RepID=UPI0007C86F53